MTDEIKNVSVRFPVDLHVRIVATAEQDRRSFNSEVLTLIEEALDARAGDSSAP
jgi:predicted HicB family RNase H-like nuclease